MITNNWIKQWVRKKIKYYQDYLNEHQDSPLRQEISNNIKILKELL